LTVDRALLRSTLLLAVFAAFAAGQAQAQSCLIETIAGGGRSFSGDGGPALEAEFDGLTDAVAASDGTIFAADSRNGRVRRISPDGIVTTLAGPQDGLVEPTRLAIAPAGAVLAYDGGARRIWRINATGVAETLLDLRLDRTAHLGKDLGLAVGADGVVYIAAPETNRVWRLDAESELAPFAGTGEPGDAGNNGDGGPAVMATLSEPQDVDVGPDGLVYVAETGGSRVRRVNADGSIETHLNFGVLERSGGTFASFLLGSFGVAGPRKPLRIAVGDGSIDVLVAESFPFRSSYPGFIDVGLTSVPRQAPPDVTGLLRPYPVALDSTSAYRYSSDGEALLASAGLPNPRSVAQAPDGPVLLVDSRDQLWAVSAEPDAVRDLSGLAFPATRPERVAGLGADGAAGDGGPASEARLFSPREVVARRSGEIFIADATRVRWIDRSGIIRALPGDLPNARLAVDPKDNVYIATKDRILRMRSSGVMEKIADFEACESVEQDCGDGGPVRDAKFLGFSDMAAGSDGTLYVLDKAAVYSSIGLTPFPVALTPERDQIVVNPSDFDPLWPYASGQRLRTISPQGQVGTAIPEEQLLSSDPTIGPDASGGILLSSSVQGNLLRVSGTTRTVVPGSAGFVESFWSGGPSALVGGPNQEVYFSRDNTVRRISADGHINTIAGRVGHPGHSGDGGRAEDALLDQPASLALTGNGDLLIADASAGTVRIIRDPAGCDSTLRPQIRLDGVRKVGLPSSGFGFAVNVIPSSRLTPYPFVERMAPGSLISIYGARLGPTPGAQADLASLDRLPIELGGVSVEIDGRPAPLLFASSGQINAVVPAETTTSGEAYLRVTVNGVASDESILEMRPSAPSVLAVLNEDGSPNGQANKQSTHRAVTVLVSGLRVGGVDPGRIARDDREVPSEGLRIEEIVDEREVEILSVRTVRGSPESLLAIRFVDPRPLREPFLGRSFELQVGDGSATTFTVSLLNTVF